ncbi:MAG TPA: hypothetical protein VI688_05240 [Anaerolineales bacterium]|nr:hypothetical protein [Anaerolineales bacterium]HLE73627.1 hypothetical protein [Anaerolineales bacterium]
MELGELFLIEDLRMNLEERVLWAAARYHRRYGQQPTLCLLHPSLLEGERQRLGRLRLVARKNVLPNYLWLGSPVDGPAKPLAR